MISSPNLLHKQLDLGDNAPILSDEQNRDYGTRIPFLGKWYFHITAIAIIMAYEISISKVLGSSSGVFDFTVYYIVNIALFYLSAFYLVPCLYKRENTIAIRIVIGILAFLFQVLALISISHLVRFFNSGSLHYDTTFIQLIQAIWRSFYLLGISWAYWLAIHHIIKSRREKALLIRQKEMEHQSMLLENAYLQTRINPHFLFNTLNFIYSSALQKSENTSIAISELSDIMRYSLQNPDKHGKVDLVDEIDNIDKFIKIIKLRFGERLSLNYSVVGEIEKGHYRILPHLLMTFIENLTKHGDLQDPYSPAIVYLKIDCDILELKISNKKLQSNALKTEQIGITNALTRLESYYPNKHTLTIHDNTETYELNLTIEL